MRVFVIKSISEDTSLIEAVPISSRQMAEGIVKESDKIMPMLFGEKEISTALDNEDIIEVEKESGSAHFVIATSSFEEAKAVQEIQNYLSLRDYEVFDEDNNPVVHFEEIFAQGGHPYSPIEDPVNGLVYAGVDLCPVQDGEAVSDLGPNEVSDTRTLSIKKESSPTGYFYADVATQFGIMYLDKRLHEDEHVFNTFVQNKESIVDAILESDSARTRVLPDFQIGFRDSQPAKEYVLVASNEKTKENGPLSFTRKAIREKNESEVMEAIEKIDITPWISSLSSQDKENDEDPPVIMVDNLENDEKDSESPKSIIESVERKEVPPIVVAALASSSKGGSWQKGRDPLVLDRSMEIGVVIIEDLYQALEVDEFSASLPGRERRHKDAEGASIKNNSGGLDGYAFACTGQLDGFKNRDKFADYVVSNGGKFKSSMSRHVDVLVKGDLGPRSTTQKFDYAQENDIPIVSIDDIMNVVTQGKLPDDAFSA